MTCKTCGGTREIPSYETINGRPRRVVNECPDCKLSQQAPGLLVRFSVAYMDGLMMNADPEAARHWKRVREAALGVSPCDRQPK